MNNNLHYMRQGVFATLLVLIIMVFFMGCDQNMQGSTAKVTLTQSTAATAASGSKREEVAIEKGSDDFIEGKIESTPIWLTDGCLQNFEQYLQSVVPEYEYSDLYQIDAALAEYNKKATKQVARHAHDVRVNGKLDPNALYQIVKRNNEAFFSDGKHAKAFYKEYSNKELKEMCSQLCKTISMMKDRFPEVDMDTICCNLYDLKILKHISLLMDNAALNSENVFHFDKEQLHRNSFAMNSKMSDSELEETVWVHETMHFGQTCCACFLEGEKWRIGINHEYADLDIQPLEWLWLIEASAEMNMCTVLDVEPTTYQTMISYANTMKMVTQLDDRNSVDAVERLNFGHDIEEIFDLLDLHSEAEREECIKMMYSIEVLQKKPKGFCDAYEQAYQKDLSNSADADELNLTIKDDALLTLTKLFYRNLAREIHNGKATMQDMFYLLRAWEAKLDNHFNNAYAEFPIFQYFYQRYIEIQNVFFEQIAQDNSMDKEKLNVGFSSYSMRVRDGEKEKSPNCDLLFLSRDKKVWLTEYVKTYYQKGYLSMRECADLAHAGM